MSHLLNTPMLEGEYEDRPDTVDPFAGIRSELQNLAQFTTQQLAEYRTRLERIERGLAIAVGSSSAPVAESIDSRKSAIWDAWKQRLGSKVLSAIIDALLTHGELDANQIAVITRCGRGNVATYMSRLNKVNLINKNGNKFSLKEV